jgi:hypothetical protein
MARLAGLPLRASPPLRGSIRVTTQGKEKYSIGAAQRRSAMAWILLLGKIMHSRDQRVDWAISCAFFAAILLALICAAVIQNPSGITFP